MNEVTKEVMRGLRKDKLEPGVFTYHEDLPVPVIGDDEVLIKVHVAAFCGSDMHLINWDDWSKKWSSGPFIPGHEICGTIVEVGKNVTERAVGQRVSCESHINCGKCYMCTHGMSQVCENLELFGVGRDGGFAEYTKAPWDITYVIEDDTLPDETVCLFEPMGAGVHGVEKAEVMGKRVLISGCGPIGLTAVAAAKTFGAEMVIVCDIFDDKLETAKKMGADYVFNSMKVNVTEEVLKLTGGRGCDAAIDITEAQAAYTAALKALRPGGRLVGVALPQKEISLDLANDVFYREVEITGISGRLIWQTWDDFAKVMAGPYFKAEYVLGQKFDLKDIDKLVQTVKDGAPGKMLLYPNGVPEEN